MTPEPPTLRRGAWPHEALPDPHAACSAGVHGVHVSAVDGVDFEILPGQTLGLVGESGSGKSTLGRCVLRLLEIDGGELRFDGRDVTKRRAARAPHASAATLQMVFQDPYSSFDPRATVGSTSSASRSGARAR